MSPCPIGNDAPGWRHPVKATEEVTAGLAESNGSLPPGGWLKVTCGLTACTPGSAPGQTLRNEYGKTLTFLNISKWVNRSTFSVSLRNDNHS